MDVRVSRLEALRTQYNRLADCQHAKTRLTATTASDGSRMYAMQCETCWAKIGNWIPHAEVRTRHVGLMGTIPEFDRERADEIWRERSRLRDEMTDLQNEGSGDKPSGIPTIYKGYQFRSRVEATWAAFMDQLGWKREYEPFDLGGYIPDFVITGKREIIVEVKHSTLINDLAEHEAKIEDSGWKKDAIIVGATPIFDCQGPGWMPLGEYGQYCQFGDGITGEMNYGLWWAYGLWFRCAGCHMISFFHEEASYACPLCLKHDGDGHIDSVEPAEIKSLWAKARNATQWRPR